MADNTAKQQWMWWVIEGLALLAWLLVSAGAGVLATCLAGGGMLALVYGLAVMLLAWEVIAFPAVAAADFCARRQ